MDSNPNTNRFGIVFDFDHENEETDFVKRRQKQTTYASPVNRQSRVSVINQRLRHSIALVQEALDDGILSFITLKVILWDLVISVGDMVFDFLQGFKNRDHNSIYNFQLKSDMVDWIFHLVRVGWSHCILVTR